MNWYDFSLGLVGGFVAGMGYVDWLVYRHFRRRAEAAQPLREGEQK